MLLTITIGPGIQSGLQELIDKDQQFAMEHGQDFSPMSLETAAYIAILEGLRNTRFAKQLRRQEAIPAEMLSKE